MWRFVHGPGIVKLLPSVFLPFGPSTSDDLQLLSSHCCILLADPGTTSRWGTKPVSYEMNMVC